MKNTRVRKGLLLCLGIAFAILGATRSASAIPLFANAQGGVSCQMCHTSVPNLNATGRYILATNFARVLDAHAQMTANEHQPAALEVTVNRSSIPDPTFGTKLYAGVIDLLSAGYLGEKVTYYASVPIVESGFPSTAIDQGWLAYNGLDKGNGSLQVGKFPTPFFAPWLSMNLSLSGYAFGALPVGLNTVGVGDNRWGASYTQIGKNGLIGNVAYMTNTSTFEQAYDNDIDGGGEGESWLGSVMYMQPTSRLSGGVALMRGTLPLPSGTLDTYVRGGALIAYSGSNYMLLAADMQGSDNNPNDGLTPGSLSHGFSLESIYGINKYVNLDLRYDTTNDGLGGIANNYIGDMSINLAPNIVFTVENASTVGSTPVWSYQLLWGGPWWKNH